MTERLNTATCETCPHFTIPTYETSLCSHSLRRPWPNTSTKAGCGHHPDARLSDKGTEYVLSTDLMRAYQALVDALDTYIAAPAVNDMGFPSNEMRQAYGGLRQARRALEEARK